MLLHLEDATPLADIMRIAIKSYDPEVAITHFVNSDDALVFIQQHLYDIAVYVLDVRVPGSMNGVELAKEIRALGFRGPIFINSAYRKPAKKTLKTYNCKWIEKPWHILDAAQLLAPLAKSKPDIKLGTSES
jgi:DNA-binding LytR/AlgR family response regulator